MNRLIIAILASGILTSASYQKSSGGFWTFKSTRAKANMFIPHGYSFAAFDTTQQPQPKFIVDFHTKFPKTGGKFKVVKGLALTDTEISIGTGVSQGGVLTFYSSTGGDGRQMVDVTVSADGRISLTGSGIEMVNQTNEKDFAPLDFRINFAQ